METAIMEKGRKVISVSSKRQITLPLNFYTELGIKDEVECKLVDDAIVIRPINSEDGSYFAELVLADLLRQGYKGEELLVKFKEMNQNIRQAAKNMLEEANQIARGEMPAATMDDLFD